MTEKEIEVGEYVRTRNGKIRKVKDTVAQYYITDRLNILDNNQFEKEDIVKHSKNIIDLIEETDIVEYRVNCLSELKVGRVKKYKDARSNKKYLEVEGFDIIKIYVERILAYEQYEKNCYRLGD